jgi:hypothetical protein
MIAQRHCLTSVFGEGQDHEHHQIDVLVDLVGLSDVLSRPTDEELQCAVEGPVGDVPAESEQADRGDDEADGVFLLVSAQRRCREPPDLPHHYWQTQDQSTVERRAHAGAQSVERSETVQTAVAIEVGSFGTEFLVRLGQKAQDRVVEQQDDDHAESDGENRTNDPEAQFRQMLCERCLVVETLHLRFFASPENHDGSACSEEFASGVMFSDDVVGPIGAS